MSKPTEIVITITLDENHTKPMYWQLADHIRQLIIKGKACTGDRLPSLRKLATQLNCSLDTVKKAYEILTEEGFLTTQRGARHQVERKENLVPPTLAPLQAQVTPCMTEVNNQKFSMAERTFENYQALHIADKPLAIYSPNMGSIQEKEFLRLAGHLARTPRLNHYYSDPAGLPALRKAICERLRQMRGILCDTEQIIITNGTLQSLNLVAQLLFQPNDTVCLEDPTLDLFAKVFRYNALKVVGIPVDKDGFPVQVAKEKAPEAKGVLVTPASQTPMSVTMSEARRKALIDWAFANKAWIIEDDTDNLLWVSGSQVPPIRALPRAEHCVIYMESFSLQFSPGIKLAYLLVPKGLEKAFIGAKLLTDRGASESTQALLAKYFDSEGAQSYLRKLQKQFMDRFHFTIKAGNAILGAYGTFADTRVGPHLAFFLKPDYPDHVVTERVRNEGIIVRALSQYWRDTSRVNGLSIGFGTFTEDEIRGAFEKIAHVCETLKTH